MGQVARGLPSTWNRSINMYVPSAQFSAEVDINGKTFVEFGSPVALSAAGILSAQSIAATATVIASSFAGTYSDSVMGRYGRNVTMVASGAATSTVRIDGRDYLGQKMSETFTLNGAATVQGKKAFARVSQVVILTTTGGTTINVGWGDKLGLPFRAIGDEQWYEDGVKATAGTLTVGASATTAQDATSNDPRGLALPNSATNGTRTYAVAVRCDKTQLYGIAHYSA